MPTLKASIDARGGTKGAKQWRRATKDMEGAARDLTGVLGKGGVFGVAGAGAAAGTLGGALGAVAIAAGLIALPAAVAVKALAAIGPPVAALTAESIGLAAEMEIVQRRFETVFGDAAPAAAEELAHLAASVGRNRTELTAAAASIQDVLVPMGFMREEAALMSTDLVRLAVDLASFVPGVDERQALLAFERALSGEREALKTLGVGFNEAEVQAEALRLGLIQQGDDLNQVAEAVATYSILLQKSADAQGAAERNADTLAETMTRFTAQVRTAKEELGEELTPVVEDLIDDFGGLETSFAALSLGVDVLKASVEGVIDTLDELLFLARAVPGVDELLGLSGLEEAFELKRLDFAAQRLEAFTGSAARAGQVIAALYREAQRLGLEGQAAAIFVREGIGKELESLRKDVPTDVKNIEDLGGAFSESLAVGAQKAALQVEGLNLAEEGLRNVSQSVSGALGDVAVSYESLGAAGEAVMTALIRRMVEATAQALIFQQILGPLLVPIFGKSIVGSAFGINFSKQGNVFAGGGNVVPFQKGGLIEGTAIFPLAGGRRIGIAGEQGKEAAFPITRDSQGDLAVKAVLPGGGEPSQTFIFQGPTVFERGIRRATRHVRRDSLDTARSFF